VVLLVLLACERASDVEALSLYSSQRRRSESNRRMEVLQTSALPLGYGAGEREASAL
jgi:Tfp pilus assembly protein PilP